MRRIEPVSAGAKYKLPRPALAREPVAEGVIPLKENGRRDWESAGDDEVLAYARQLISGKGISRKIDLENEDPALCHILRKRNLLDRLGFVPLFRKWGTDEEILSEARKLLAEGEIRKPSQLRKKDPRLYSALSGRGLIKAAGFPEMRKSKPWGVFKKMSDEEIIAHADRVLSENKLTNAKGLRDFDSGLYTTLSSRRLLGRVSFTKRKRNWGGEGELIAKAKAFIDENGIRNPSDLIRANKMLYSALTRRGLHGKIEYPQKTRKWGPDEEVLANANSFIR